MELSGQGCTVYVFVIWIVLFVFRLTKIPIQVIGKCDGYNCTYAANESIYKMVSNVSRMQFFFYNVHRTLTSLLLMCYKELVHCYFSTKNQPTVDQLSVRLSVIC